MTKGWRSAINLDMSIIDHVLVSRWRWLLLFLLGAASALAQPPFHAQPVLALTLPGLILALHSIPGTWWRAGAVWLFFWGYFIAGLYWVGIAFFVDAERFIWMLPLPILGLPALLASFSALGVAMMISLFKRWAINGPSFILLMILGLSLGDYGRSHLFSGFPWNLWGYSWTEIAPIAQANALIGIHGLSVLTLFAFSWLAILHPSLRLSRSAIINAATALTGFFILGLLGLWGVWRLETTAIKDVPGIILRLVQGNVSQHDKWQQDLRAEHLRLHINLSLEPSQSNQAPTHIIWSETALPFFLDDGDIEGRRFLSGVTPAGGLFLFGAPRRARTQDNKVTLWNSLYALDDGGVVRAIYDKKHLVPFGEYLPLRDFLAHFGIDKLAAGPVDFSSGQGPSVLALPGLPPVQVLICYEGIFTKDVAPTDQARPGWLLNVTNDGWFGQSTGPYQHYATIRTRALEQGLPAVRVANTGISAIIDPLGRPIAELGLGQRGSLDGPLPQALVPTVYARWGETGFILILILALGAAAVLSRRMH